MRFLVCHIGRSIGIGISRSIGISCGIGISRNIGLGCGIVIVATMQNLSLLA
jgi:CRISPR/Cas system endoribonuclease Cas6 (RAMP superfamily)